MTHIAFAGLLISAYDYCIQYTPDTYIFKMLRFKFQQNRTINEEFDILRGWGGGSKLGSPFINCNYFFSNFRKITP